MLPRGIPPPSKIQAGFAASQSGEVTLAASEGTRRGSPVLSVGRTRGRWQRLPTASSACGVAAQQGGRSGVTLTTVSSSLSSELQMMMLVSSAGGTGRG